jgi:hypothetical protein
MAPLFEWAKTVHALDRVATVTGCTVIPSEINATVKRENIAMYFLASLLRNHIAVAPYVKFSFSNRLTKLISLVF